MGNSSTTSKLEPLVDEIRGLARTMNKTQVAVRFGVSEGSIRRLDRKHSIWANTTPIGAPPPQSVLSDDPSEWGDIKTLVESRGLSLDDWMVAGSSMTDWGHNPETGEPYRRLKVDLKPRLGLLMPARSDGWTAPPRPPRPKTATGLVALFGDHHAPHHDPDLHTAVCEWLRANKPDEGIILGDLVDLDAVSRHRHSPEWGATLQDCFDHGYSILRAYVQASPNTRWRMLAGNHEDRLRNSILDHLKAAHGLTPGTTDDEERARPVLSIPYLLRLDELGIEWIDAGGEYAHGQVQITPELAARHGWIARKGSGASALATIDHLRFSVVIGHTHRQSIVHHTAHSIDGDPRTLLGAEAGTLAKIRGGLGYAVAADWQQGFATAQVWDDGLFKLDLATWVDGSLLWRNSRIAV